MKGMKPPAWTPAADRAFSATIGVRTAILSVSTPGVGHIADPDAAAAAARAMNEHCAALRDEDPSAAGFFATVPCPLARPDLALAEVRHALDALAADGVTLFTRYDGAPDGRDGYLGHDAFLPLWRELDARRAVVFVHPVNGAGARADLFNEKLPLPGFDWPHETGRAAMDLILHGRLRQFPGVKIILSHAGGTLPALVRRATMVALPEFGATMSAEDILSQAKSFYFDLALAGGPELLPLILGFAEPGHVLFGSDYPHAPPAFSNPMTKFIDEYEMDDELRREIYHGAAEKLFPRLKGNYAA